jgi:hypothetical protein
MTPRAAPQAEIHDLGYTRYQGARTAPGRRFLVIAGNVIRVGWQRRWGVKAQVLFATLITLGGAVMMYVRMKVSQVPLATVQNVARQADRMVIGVINVYLLPAALLALVVGCSTIADDLRMGAFQFYFSRPIRARDYVAGKVLGTAFYVGIPLLLGPVLLALIRLLFSSDLADAGHALPMLPRALAAGAIATTAFTLLPLGMGALLQKRIPAQALWTVYLLLIGAAAEGFAQVLHAPVIRAVALLDDVSVVTRAVFGEPSHWRDPPAWAAATALALLCAAGLALVAWRVRNAETAGLGGS